MVLRSASEAHLRFTGLYQTLQVRLKEAAGELKQRFDALAGDICRDGAAIQFAGDALWIAWESA